MPSSDKPASKRSADLPTGVKLDPSLKKRLEELSHAKERSTHWLMKQAIEQYVIAEEEALALKQETLQRWEKEALLNDTIPNTDVMQWLDTWNEKGVKTPKWK